MKAFIALDGCDGAGKTSFRGMLECSLMARGERVFSVGQHSWLNIDASKIISSIRSGVGGLLPEAIVNAYRVDKVLHYNENISPALHTHTVIADRWFFSDAVYQEALYGISAASTIELYYAASQMWPSDLIYVECCASTAYDRICRRQKNMRHYERPAELRLVQDIYGRLLDCSSVSKRTRVHWVDNSGSVNELEAKADVIAEFLVFQQGLNAPSMPSFSPQRW